MHISDTFCDDRASCDVVANATSKKVSMMTLYYNCKSGEQCQGRNIVHLGAMAQVQACQGGEGRQWCNIAQLAAIEQIQAGQGGESRQR